MTASVGSEFVAGSGNDNEFHGRGGDDRLTGNAGNDTLDGGTGDDVLRGGTETDTATYVDSITPDDLATTVDADPFTVGNQAGWTVTSATEGTDKPDRRRDRLERFGQHPARRLGRLRHHPGGDRRRQRRRHHPGRGRHL